MKTCQSCNFNVYRARKEKEADQGVAKVTTDESKAEETVENYQEVIDDTVKW